MLLKKIPILITCMFLVTSILFIGASSGTMESNSGYQLGWSRIGGVYSIQSGSDYELSGSNSWLYPRVLSGDGYTLTVLTLEGSFEEIDYEFKYGDVNGDGEVDIMDVIIVLRHIVGLENIIGEGLLRAKVSPHGEDIGVADAILILRYIVGLITEFPMER